MEDGPPGFPRGSTCPAVLRVSLGRRKRFAYGPVTLCGRPFQILPLHFSPPITGPYNPWVRRPKFGLIRVRSPLLAESLLISSPPGTEMFQFPGFASRLPGMTGYYAGRVAPFGDLRIKACLAAPRSLSQLTASFFASQRQGIHRLPFPA